jgi:serine protease Do
MLRFSRTRTLFLFGTSMCTLTTLGLLANPGVFAQLSYASEQGKAMVAKEQLAMAHDLSRGFQHVADAMRPSVVSVSSSQKIRTITTRSNGSSRTGNSPFSRLPPEFRQFFGDDVFGGMDRFERLQPREGIVKNGMGTGVIISHDGYIVTNNHVIADADNVTITLSNEKEYDAEVVGTDQKSDLAVLKIEASGLVPADLGDSESLRVGEWVLAIGSPFGLTQTVTAGIVSATGRQNVGVSDYENFIQTDAAINPGNSGGPLVNLEGQVVGINTAIASKTGGYMGVGFSIPSSMVRLVTDRIISNGKVERGWLGAAIQNVTDDLARSFAFDGTEGVLIGDVVPDSPAESAGLQSGDIILEFNGKLMKSANQLRNFVAVTSPNTSCSMRVFRNGKEQTMSVTLGELDDAKIAAYMGKGDSAGFDDLGISVQSITPELADKLNLSDSEQGIVITEVQPGSLADNAGISEGDVIASANGQNIASAKQFGEVADAVKSDRGLRLLLQRDGFSRFVFIRSS